MPYGHIADLRYIHAAYGDGKAFLFQPFAVAVGAGDVGHVFLYLALHEVRLRFPVSPFKIGYNAFKGGIVAAFAKLLMIFNVYAFRACAVKNDLFCLGGKLLKRGVKAEPVFFSQSGKIHAGY